MNSSDSESPFMTYAGFESILMPEYNGKEIPDESYTSKYKQTCFLPLTLQISMCWW